MRRKKRLNICAILGIAVIVVVGVFAYPLLFENVLTPSPTSWSKKIAQPDELLQQYFAHVGNGQYEDMYEMLTEQQRSTISEDEFVAKNKSIYSGIEAKNIEVTIIQVSDNTTYGNGGESDVVRKTVDYSLRMDTLADEISYTNQAVFIEDMDKEYRMQWTAHTIFPNLNSDDKVRVNTLTAKRGCIYDRNREMLAGPGVASAVGFVPGKMRKENVTAPFTDEDSALQNDSDSLESTDISVADKYNNSEDTLVSIYNAEDIAKVAELLETTPESIIKKLNASYVKDDTFVQLKIVSKEEHALADELLTVKGIMISNTAVRYYPLGEKASHLVGYIQGINAEELDVLREQGYHMNSVLGKAGLEKIYEEQLRTKDGCEIIIVDSNGNVKETLAKREKVDGQNITLTIDAQIQSQLYDQFAQDKSCSVAMNPKTGEVLALVSTPTYDANDFVLGMSMSKWTALNEDENKPMYNRFKAALCPGSTMKGITAAIGVNTGILSPNDDFGHSGLRWRKDESWGGYYVTTTKEYDEPANIENALVYSDNIFYAKAALKMGEDMFAEQLSGIGFEERIPFEYGLYSSIISSTETFTSEIQLADSGFGQGQILVNPIHMATIYAAFVNNGNIIQPRLIYGRDDTPIIWKENAFSPETAKVIRNGLIQVIERGTGKDAKISGITLAGKTGTAETKQSKDDMTGTELGWFVLFTADDTENPLLVVSMVEDVKNRGGSHYVIPKVRKAFQYRY